MPGPPPPSKSYLLKFDSSSDEESDDEQDRLEIQQQRMQQQRQDLKSQIPDPDPEPIDPTANSGLLHYLSTITGINGASKEDSKQHQQEEEEDSESQSNKKKGKKRKKKKKKKSSSCSSTASVSTCNSTSTSSVITLQSPQPLVAKKKVQFSNVIVSEFIRDIHGDGVPMDGGYPLSLSHNLHQTYHLPLVDFESKKQIELKLRYEKYILNRRKRKTKQRERASSSKIETRSSSGRRKRSNSKVTIEEMKHNQKHSSKERNRNRSDSIISIASIPDTVPVFIPPGYHFETRQFDHKVRHSEKIEGEDVYGKKEWQEVFETGRNILFGLKCESERKALLFRDAQLQLHSDDGSGTGDSNDNPAHQQLSKKFSKRKESISEEIFCSLDLQHVQHELEQIRIHRSAENVAGCSCRKLHVVLPKDLNGGKKSHNHRRLKEQKVKDELRKRHITIPKECKSREELEQLLYDEVEKHGCCYGNDCPCARSGIGCQSDTCSCWFKSHVTHKKESKGEIVSPDGAQQRCGNKNGIYVVDFDAIEKYRDRFITARDAGICGSIDS